MEQVLNLCLLFIIYSVVGYISEVITCTIIDKKLSFFRGFLIGPWIPIYGFGSTLMIVCLSSFKDNHIVVFVLGMLLCSVLEYLTSYVMEKIYGLRWWDYSNDRFNLNGRICLRNALLFGLGGVAVCCLVNPIIVKYINMVNFNILTIVTGVLSILYIIDVIISGRIVARLKSNANKFSNPDVSEEIKAEILLEVSKNIKGYSRILKAFPHMFKSNNHRFDEFNHYLLLIKTGFKQIGKSFKKQLNVSFANNKLFKELNNIKKDFTNEFNALKKEYKFVYEPIGVINKIKNIIKKK